MEQKRCSSCMKLKTEKICEHCGYDEDTPGALHHLPAGVVLQDQYLIGRVLGQGGFGITYLGWDRNLDTPIAVKEYFPNGYVQRNHERSLEVQLSKETQAQFHNGKEYFLREAKILARLSDVPEVVHIRNYFQANGTAYIVMEYINGVTLSQFIRKRGEPLRLAQALEILQPVMAALAQVHDAELIHRDISPDNIMLYHNRVKLVDFGAARDTGSADASKVLPKSTLAMVKHGYAPLEQYQSRGALGPWTDVYALCATLYFCLTGRAPASAPDRLNSDAPLDWKAAAPELTTQQLDILDRAMALRPKDRMKDMRALSEGLLAGCQNGGDAGKETRQRKADENAGPKAAAKATRDAKKAVHHNAASAIQSAGRRKKQNSKTVTVSPYAGKYPETVVLSQSAGQYPETVPLSQSADKYPETVPLSQSADKYPETVAASRGTGKYPETVAASRGNSPYPKTVPARGGTYDFPATAFAGTKSKYPGTESGKKDPQDQSNGRKGTGKKPKNGRAIRWVLILLLLAAVGIGILVYQNYHVWTEATCTDGSVCTICGKTGDMAATGHDYSQRTCEEPSVCRNCGLLQEEAAGHRWVEATCTSAKVCSVCGTTEGGIPGHDWMEATETAPMTCSRCGETTGNVNGYVGTIGGTWKPFYSAGYSAYCYVLDTPIHGCKTYTMNLSITNVTHGNVEGRWEAFYRDGYDRWVSLGYFDLEEDKISITYEFDKPTDVTAVTAVVQGRSGNFSKSITVTDVIVY